MFRFRIAFKLFSSKDYLIDGNRLRGYPSSDIRTLSKFGYDVIAINYESFKQIPDPLRASHIVNLIDDKRRSRLTGNL